MPPVHMRKRGLTGGGKRLSPCSKAFALYGDPSYAHDGRWSSLFLPPVPTAQSAPHEKWVNSKSPRSIPIVVQYFMVCFPVCSLEQPTMGYLVVLDGFYQNPTFRRTGISLIISPDERNLCRAYQRVSPASISRSSDFSATPRRMPVFKSTTVAGNGSLNV